MTGNEKGNKVTAEILVESEKDRKVTIQMKLTHTTSQNAPQATIIMEDGDHMAGIRLHPGDDRK